MLLRNVTLRALLIKTCQTVFPPFLALKAQQKLGGNRRTRSLRKFGSLSSKGGKTNSEGPMQGGTI